MRNVLVIDDSKSVHAFVKQCFTDQQITIFSCFNGQEAIDHLKSLEKSYDLILLDWEMPIKDGPSTIKDIIGLNIPTPVLMMTSRNSVADIEQMLTLGASEYIMKPYTKDILLGKISNFMDVKYENAS